MPEAVAAVCIVAMLAAWLSPQPKPASLWGRYTFGQIVLAVVITWLGLAAIHVMMTPRRRRKITGFKWAAVTLSCLVVVLAEESALFALNIWTLNPWYHWQDPANTRSADDELMYVRRPHMYWEGVSRGDLLRDTSVPDPYAIRVVFQTDDHGFRNSREFDRAALVFIGDSFTEAGNVPEEQTFVQLVGRAVSGPAVNLGCAGYGGAEELIVLRRHGLPKQPKIVVWQICEWNDLFDEWQFSRWREKSAAERRQKVRGSAFKRMAGRWKRTSLLYRFYRRHAPRPLSTISGIFTDRDGRSHKILFHDWFNRLCIPDGHVGLPLLKRSIREGIALCRERGIYLIVMVMPMKIRAMGPSIRFDRDDVGPLWRMPEGRDLASRLRPLCEGEGVTFVDLLPLLRERASCGELVYFPYDSHLAPAGHKVVADAVVAAIRQTGAFRCGGTQPDGGNTAGDAGRQAPAGG